MRMDVEERFRIVRSIGEECIQEDELWNLLTKKPHPICYDGFEPSGRMHIAQGIMKTINVNKLTSAGCKVKIWIADWFAQLNNKMGGDIDKIQTVGRYLIEVWKAAGMNLEGGNVEFLWSSEEIMSRPHEYWPIVTDIARRNKLPRITRCCQIMGRKEQDELTGGQIFYPCMQCADIFFLKADICQLGMDQRKVNVLAREYCDDIKRKNKPIILSHHMLPGLLEGQEKMAKSNPNSAIFMEDEEAVVNLKIQNTYCPPNLVDRNPCLEYIKYIVLPWFKEFKVEQKTKNGEKTYTSFDEISADYVKGDLQPADIKPALAKALNRILQPVRDHFKNDERAKAIFEAVKGFEAAKLPDHISNEQDKRSLLMENPIEKEVESLFLKAEDESASSNSSNAQMSVEERFRIVRSIGEECIQEEELLNLLTKKPQPICYDGFEPSGRMHIAQGVMKTINVNKLTSAGCKVKIWIADWFAQLNNKMGGDLNKIQVVGRYLIEIWKATGMNLENVEFIWSSEEINSRAHEYWPIVMDIATRNKLPRIMRCCQIMGRTDQDELTAAQIFYPCMQCADIFFLKADICQLGMDQRKVNVLAREYCDDTKRKNKPIILSHHMLPGLLQGQEKMSKSDPNSAIFMEDEEADVNSKIKNHTVHRISLMGTRASST
ncbi:putative tyrosine--tRNA ligase [Helianthus debilis subsp. tardiflorus]